MDKKDERGGFNYEEHERLKKELEEEAGIDAKNRRDANEMAEQLDAEASDANEDADFGDPVITGDLPPFWKPETVGERRIGEVTAVRKTKDFGQGQGPGEAINLRGAAGLFALPISAGLVDIDWRKQIGRIFLFVFKGWIELSPTTKMRKFVVRPKKGDGVPY